jgi:hypothetical protein
MVAIAATLTAQHLARQSGAATRHAWHRIGCHAFPAVCPLG